MSVEILIVPLILDAIVATSILMEDHKKATFLARYERGLATESEIRDMQLEADGYKRAGLDIRSGNSAETRGSAVLVHTDKGYDIGLKKNAKGSFDVVVHWNETPGKIQIRQVREEIESKIKQKYAYEKVKRELAKNGFMITTEETKPDETIRLVARKW